MAGKQQRAARRHAPAHGATRKQQPAAAAKRGWGFWFNGVLVVFAGAVVLAAAVQGGLYLRSIPVQQIRVTGELAYTRAEAIQEIVQPALRGGFLGADLQRIRECVEQLPWVYRATVRRRWPAALELHVVEQLAIARWGDQGFLNHGGEIFNSSTVEDQQSLPLLQGPDGTAQELAADYLRLTALLQPLGLTVSALHLDTRRQLEAELDGGLRVLMGNRDFRERMQRFTAVYREHLAGHGAAIERIDLRYESGLAVAFKTPDGQPAAEPESAPPTVAGL